MTTITPPVIFILILTAIFMAIIIGILVDQIKSTYRAYHDSCEMWQYDKLLSTIMYLFTSVMACALTWITSMLLYYIIQLVTNILGA